MNYVLCLFYDESQAIQFRLGSICFKDNKSTLLKLYLILDYDSYHNFMSLTNEFSKTENRKKADYKVNTSFFIEYNQALALSNLLEAQIRHTKIKI